MVSTFLVGWKEDAYKAVSRAYALNTQWRVRLAHGLLTGTSSGKVQLYRAIAKDGKIKTETEELSAADIREQSKNAAINTTELRKLNDRLRRSLLIVNGAGMMPLTTTKAIITVGGQAKDEDGALEA